MAINLLPSEKIESKETQKTVSLLTRVAIAVGTIVIIEGLAGAGLLLFFNSKLQNAQQKHDLTISQISSLEITEQELVLVKDRLGKIQTVVSDRGNFTTIDKFNTVINTLPTNIASVERIEISPGISKLTLVSTNSDELKNLVEQMSNSSEFSSSLIKTLNFSQGKGFEVQFDAN